VAKNIKSTDSVESVKQLTNVYTDLRREISKVIVGQDTIIEHLFITLLSRGHCLLIGVPGLAKTLLIKTLAQALDLKFSRIQFTPDLMPSDITGTEIIEENVSTRTKAFKFIRGPVFANIILADEINRTPPKTQAALLEAMQEHHVTAAGETYMLDEPFSFSPHKIRLSRKERTRYLKPSLIGLCSISGWTIRRLPKKFKLLNPQQADMKHRLNVFSLPAK
jgi:replication-associated recombination protein RarA